MAKSKDTSRSLRSRAVRREASPSFEIDKSVASLPRVEPDTVQRPSILFDRANSGVSKKQAKSKPKSRAQKLRQQKGMNRAETVVDQLEKKVTDSVKRGKNVKARRANWDELNHKSGSMFAALQANTADDNADNSNDANDVNVAGDGDAAMVDDAAPASSNNNKPVVLGPNPQSHHIREPVVDQHAGIAEEDEIT